MTLRLRILVPALLLGAACASADPPSSAPNPSAASTLPRGRNAPITQAMIQATQDGNLYRVVRQLQPTWLQVPPSPTGEEIGVFLDDRYIGGPDVLSQIPTTQVAEVRYLNARQVRSTLAEFQSENLAAAIMVISLRVRQ